MELRDPRTPEELAAAALIRLRHNAFSIAEQFTFEEEK